MSLQQWAGAQRLTLALVFTYIVGSTRRALTQRIEQAEKAGLAAGTKLTERSVSPRLNLSPTPSGAADTSMPPPGRNPLYGTLPQYSKPEPEHPPDWWKPMLVKPISP